MKTLSLTLKDARLLINQLELPPRSLSQDGYDKKTLKLLKKIRGKFREPLSEYGGLVKQQLKECQREQSGIIESTAGDPELRNVRLSESNERLEEAIEKINASHGCATMKSDLEDAEFDKLKELWALYGYSRGSESLLEFVANVDDAISQADRNGDV